MIFQHVRGLCGVVLVAGVGKDLPEGLCKRLLGEGLEVQEDSHLGSFDKFDGIGVLVKHEGDG